MVGKTLRKYWPIFVLPTFLSFLIGFLWPFVWGIYLSFCKFTTVKNVQFVGLSNYSKVLADSTFSGAFWRTILFAFTSSILINVLAFIVALALTKGIRGTKVFRTVFFMPNLIGGIVLGYIWQTILNGLLLKFGQPLLSLSARNGFIGMLILLCWQQIGYMMIIYIAGLSNVSTDLIEAAQIDGASSMQTLFRIKIPMIMSSITICTFLTLTNGFKMFDQNLSLTGGEPAKASQLLALNIYETYYARSGPQWKGIGQAKAVIFFLIVVAISLIQLRATSSKEVQA
ncbi:MAG: sugar ABC transporter permease [Lachnospiraceae bacterium]|nr:sugar ABC transporter permease [Lachnospiraceae bacterium]